MSSVDKAEQKANELRKSGESEVRELVKEDADSTDSNVRYAAYLRRIRDIARAGSRYTAYTSDIGEAFRPVVPPFVVTLAYGISWAYLAGDVGFTTYKASQQGPTPLEASTFSEPTRLSLVALKRSVFQGVASMALPAFTIHTAVKQAQKVAMKSTNVALRRWAPTAVGISIVPALPYLFDHPGGKASLNTKSDTANRQVETAVDYAFDKLEEAIHDNQAKGAGKKDL